jgi:undecaprenyl-diphosphatase
MNACGRLLASLFPPITLLVLFICLATLVVAGDTLNIDLYIRDAVHRWASPTCTSFMVAVTVLGSVLFLAAASAIAFGCFYWARWRRNAAALVGVMGGAVVLDNGLKYAFHRLRPEPFFGIAPESYSFPSGHALYSCCFYAVLANALASRTRSRVLRVCIRFVALLLTTAIGLSRIYLGVHYPSDVLGGYIVALFWISAVIVIDHAGLLSRRHPVT